MFQRHRGKHHKQMYLCLSFFVGKDREPQSINAKLFLPIIPIGIVAYALTLLWDNLCRNSCKQLLKSKKVIFFIPNNKGRSILKYAVFFRFHFNGQIPILEQSQDCAINVNLLGR